MSVTFKQTIIHFKMDLQRRLYLEDKSNTFLNGFFTFFCRGVISAFIYRINHYLDSKNNFLAKLCIRFLRYIEFHYCHIEIEPNAVIGPGLVLTDFGGIGISHVNVIGKNCTFLGKATPTLGAMEDVKVDVDKILIGDNCVIGPNVRIVNNLSIANGVQIKPNSVVMISVESEGAVISGFPAKVIYQVPMQDVVRWSPLLCRYVA